MAKTQSCVAQLLTPKNYATPPTFTDKVKKNVKQIAVITGVFISTVLISYAASSLIPTYAPGENPPSLDSAPLLYRMAGSENPDTYLASGSSLMDIKNAINELKASGVGGNNQYAADESGFMIILDGDLYTGGYNRSYAMGINKVEDATSDGKLYKTLDDVVDVKNAPNSSYGGSYLGYIARKTDGSVWVSGQTAKNARGYDEGDHGWFRIDNLTRDDSLQITH